METLINIMICKQKSLTYAIFIRILLIWMHIYIFSTHNLLKALESFLAFHFRIDKLKALVSSIFLKYFSKLKSHWDEKINHFFIGTLIIIFIKLILLIFLILSDVSNHFIL